MTPARKAETVDRAARASTPRPARARTTTATPATTPKTSTTEPLKNVTFYAARDLVNRVKNAQAATAKEPRGHRSFNAMVSAALMTETTRLERLYNDRKPYKAVPPGGIKRGRREIRLRDVEVDLVHESFAQRPSDTNHARGAWLATRFRPGGYDSFAEMIVGALEREASRLERAYNSRKPFPPRGSTTPTPAAEKATPSRPTKPPVTASNKRQKAQLMPPDAETEAVISGGSSRPTRAPKTVN